MNQVDITYENHGSVCIVRGLTPAGNEWLEDNVGNDETQYWGGGIVVEPRYLEPILEGAVADGLSVN